MMLGTTNIKLLNKITTVFISMWFLIYVQIFGNSDFSNSIINIFNEVDFSSSKDCELTFLLRSSKRELVYCLDLFFITWLIV